MLLPNPSRLLPLFDQAFVLAQQAVKQESGDKCHTVSIIVYSIDHRVIDFGLATNCTSTCFSLLH